MDNKPPILISGCRESGDNTFVDAKLGNIDNTGNKNRRQWEGEILMTGEEMTLEEIREQSQEAYEAFLLADEITMIDRLAGEIYDDAMIAIGKS